MRRYSSIMLIMLLAVTVLSGCSSSPKLGSAERKPMSEKERTAYINELYNGSTDTSSNGADLYSEDGIIVTSDHKLEVESWKLNELSKNYETQNKLDYVTKTEELTKQTGDWMTSALTTKDFKCTVRLYGDDDTMTLDIQLDEKDAGKYIIAPQSCIINGILKNKSLFKAKESESGHFLITAKMKDFKELSTFGLTMENISSIAWYLSAINLETKKMESFLLASAFPDDDTWEGLQVSDKFAATSGIVMWVMRTGDYTYLCTFNGSSKKIESDITVTATKGDMISDSFKLDVCSGEFTYQQIGFNAVGVTVKKGDTLLLKE